MKNTVQQITPSRSVIEGKNGTVAGLMALAASLERSKKLTLYNEYALFHESLEDFSERMSESYGTNWMEIL